MNSDYIVLKFGGTSQNQKTYEFILNYIENKKTVIVLSAISGITNKLLNYVKTNNNLDFDEIIDINEKLANKCNISIDDIKNDFIIKCNTKQTLDDDIEIISKGEFFTCNILNKYLRLNNINSTFLSSLDVVYSNQENTSYYNKGEFNVDSHKIIEQFKNYDVVVIPGFSGRTPSYKSCLLGRGGSDTSGSIIAAGINASLYEIWTDVNGIYSSDPRKITNTRIANEINYGLAQEVAAMGAKVIHPYCILPCANKNIPIYIKNTFDPTSKSTIITKNITNNFYGITIQDNVKVFKITSFNMWNNYGFVYDIFSVFKEFNVDINIINTSQFNITTTTEETDLNKLYLIKNNLEKNYQVELTINNSIISVVNINIRLSNKIADIFRLTKEYDIITTSYSSNDMSLSFVLEMINSIKLAQELHNIFY